MWLKFLVVAAGVEPIQNVTGQRLAILFRSGARRWLTMRNGPCGEPTDLADACQAC
jgi:hypothetical protein